MPPRAAPTIELQPGAAPPRSERRTRVVLLRCGGEEAWALQRGSGAEPQQRGERGAERLGTNGAEMSRGGGGRGGCEALPRCPSRLFRRL